MDFDKLVVGKKPHEDIGMTVLTEADVVVIQRASRSLDNIDETPHCEDIPLKHNPITFSDVTDNFFEWAEKYTPLKAFWDKVNEERKVDGGENYPYDYFKEMAKVKLDELIDIFLKNNDPKWEE